MLKEKCLQLVMDAIKENSLDSLLSGRGKWRLMKHSHFDDEIDKPTNWRCIYDYGIYELYRCGEKSIKQETEEAIIRICSQSYEDSAYLASMAWCFQLEAEEDGTAPFMLDRMIILRAIRDAIKCNKNKLLKTNKWANGSANLYYELKRINKYIFEEDYNISIMDDE